MTPSIGRIVLYRSQDLAKENNGADMAPAVITRVWSDTMVNLKVLLDAPVDKWATSVALAGTSPGSSSSWDWPPRV